MPSAELTGRALVTGGGRGIGANVARELAAAGMEVAVTGRTADQVEAVAAEIGGRALVGDVSREADVERWFAELGPVDLLVCNAGISGPTTPFAEEEPEIVVARLRGQRARRLPLLPRRRARDALARRRPDRQRLERFRVPAGGRRCRAPPTGRARQLCTASREMLATQLAPQGIFVFSISPGLVRTAMTEGHIPDDAPWTPPECAPRLVRALASGEFDALAGRYLHAEHDPPEVAARTDRRDSRARPERDQVAPVSERVVLCYGDSNTYGWIADGGGRFPRDVRWPGVLERELGPGWRVLEEGLGGRTTVFDDPLLPYRNGREYLTPCLDSHAPLDVVVIALGTNDLKGRFAASASDIAAGAALLAQIALASESGPGWAPPRVLVCGLPRLGPIVERADEFAGAHEKAALLPVALAARAAEAGVDYLELVDVAAFDDFDGFHLNADGHLAIGHAVALTIAAMF